LEEFSFKDSRRHHLLLQIMITKQIEIFLDLNPLAVTNCKSIFTGEMIAPKEIGKAAQTIVKEFLEMVSKKTGLPVTDKKSCFISKENIDEFLFNGTCGTYR
jgi:hypothetical protein